jgi:uncharacterized protein (AIM24 family)
VAQLRLSGHRVLEVRLTGETVRAITGSMVAYDGQVQLENAGMGWAVG